MENYEINRKLVLAEHLRRLRVDRDLSLHDLATMSGLSRATLSRIENGEVSPTAETLGRLASAFALPISRLLAPMEQGFRAFVGRAEQAVWLDPNNGYSRRALSPPSGHLQLEMIECEIKPHQRIAYDQPPILGHEHHLVLLSGALSTTVEDERHELLPGDCLRYRLLGSSCFETGDQPARYLIALA